MSKQISECLLVGYDNTNSKDHSIATVGNFEKGIKVLNAFIGDEADYLHLYLTRTHTDVETLEILFNEWKAVAIENRLQAQKNKEGKDTWEEQKEDSETENIE